MKVIMNELKETIREIIESIKPGLYFDTHTVIFLLRQKQHDKYLSGAQNYTNAYHSKISRIVKSYSDLVEDTKMKAYSKNVLDKFSKCQLWKRK